MLFSSEISARPSPRVLSLCVKRFSLIPSQKRTDIGMVAASKRAFDEYSFIFSLYPLFFFSFLVVVVFSFLFPFCRVCLEKKRSRDGRTANFRQEGEDRYRLARIFFPFVLLSIVVISSFSSLFSFLPFFFCFLFPSSPFFFLISVLINEDEGERISAIYWTIVLFARNNERKKEVNLTGR